MTEIYNKKYIPVGEATFGHRILREFTIPTTALAVDTDFISNDIAANFQGFSRQVFKALAIHAGAGSPTFDARIEEFIQEPSDPSQGTWAIKDGLGTINVAANRLFEHNSEDTMRMARLVITPRVLLPDGGVKIILAARRDT